MYIVCTYHTCALHVNCVFLFAMLWINNHILNIWSCLYSDAGDAYPQYCLPGVSLPSFATTIMMVLFLWFLILIFLAFRPTNDKIYFPNAALGQKWIVNYNRSPDQGDSIDFQINMKTPVKKLGILKERIQQYIESLPQFWYPEFRIMCDKIHDCNKMNLMIWLRHRINYQVFHFLDLRYALCLISVRQKNLHINLCWLNMLPVETFFHSMVYLLASSFQRFYMGRFVALSADPLCSCRGLLYTMSALCSLHPLTFQETIHAVRCTISVKHTQPDVQLRIYVWIIPFRPCICCNISNDAWRDCGVHM